MRICGIICEFNPFHNGHKYLLQRTKELSGCDKILCIMSGSFTQRGDICIMDKFERARHAVLCGADAVIELPAAFSVAPAEIFAKGAIKILNSIPEVTTLAFGCENAQADFIGAARLLNDESQDFKSILNKNLAEGESYIRSYAAAFEACGGEKDFITHPNNILGIEYAKAILNLKSKIEILPIARVGAQYNDVELKENYSSATAIRQDLLNPLVKNSIPVCVYNDLKDFSLEKEVFEQILRYKLINSDAQTLQKIYGCSEGLENRLLNLSYLPLNDFINEASSKRYSSSRIKRILVANLLGLYIEDCSKYLISTLYIRPLAVKKDGADNIMAALAAAEFPVITKQGDISKLSATTKMCFDSTENSYKIWKLIARKNDNSLGYPIFI